MKLIETVTAIQTSRAAVSAGEPERVQAPAADAPVTERDSVTDIGARRRQRRRDGEDDDDEDEDPSLPM